MAQAYRKYAVSETARLGAGRALTLRGLSGRRDEVNNCDIVCTMRTTISLDDRLAKQVRRAAAATGVSVSGFIVRVLDDALKRRGASESPKPFRLIAVGGSGRQPGLDLDRLRVIETADDEARFGHRRS